MLADWERGAGLPDSCAGGGETIQERQAAVVERLTATGGQSVVYFQAIAGRLGYTVEIDEFRPFVAGASQCGDRLGAIARAGDLECRLRRLKPGHSDLIIAYEGA